MILPRLSAAIIASACCLAGVAGTPARAFAQAAAAPTMASAITDLASGDRDRIMAGRAALLASLSAASRNPTFLASFARDLNAGLTPIAAGTDPLAKLNAAIVTQRTADQSGAVALAPLIAQFIRDDSPAIASYGLRAAANVLPRTLPSAKTVIEDPLMVAVVEALTKHSASEAVAVDAYVALTRLMLDNSAVKLLGPAAAQITPKAVDAVHQLLAQRLKQFGKGTLVAPEAEQPAISFLTRQQTWTVSTKQQQLTTVRLLLELMNGSANEMSALPAAGNRPRLEALRNLVRTAGQGLGVIADVTGNAGLRGAAAQAGELGLATPIAEYKRVIAVIQAEAVRAFPDMGAIGGTPAATGTTQAATP